MSDRQRIGLTILLVVICVILIGDVPEEHLQMLLTFFVTIGTVLLGWKEA